MSSSAARATPAAAISKGSSKPWSAKLRPVAAKEFGIETGFDRAASDAPLYAIEPVASSVTQAIVGASGAMPMKITVNAELQNKAGPERVAALDAAHRGRAAAGRQLSRRRPFERAAAQRRGAGREGGAPVRLHVGGPHPPQCRRGPPLAIAGRRDHLGRPAADRVRRAAAGRRRASTSRSMADNTRCPVTKPKLLALCGEDAESSERYRNEVLAKKKSVFDLLAGASGLRTAVPPLSRNAVAAVAALLLDLVVTCGRRLALQRDGRGGRGTGELGQRRRSRASARTTSPTAGRATPCMR